MIVAILTFVPQGGIDPIVAFDLMVRRHKLSAKAENGLGRVQTIGPDARQKAKNETA